MDILGGMENRPVLLDTEIQLEQAEIEHPPMKQKCHDADEGYDQQQQVQRPMDGSREPGPECAHAHRERRRRLAPAPPEAQHDDCPEQQTKQRMNVDPELLRTLGPGIVQQTQRADHDHEQCRQPVQCDGRRSVAFKAL